MRNNLSILILLISISCFATEADEWFRKANKAKKVEDQINYYKKALEVDSNFTKAYKKIAFRYKKLSKYSEAIQYYNKYLELSPKHARAIYERGMCYHFLEKGTLAFTDFKRAVTINPELKNWYYYSYIEHLIPDYNIEEVQFNTINTTEADSIRTLKSLIKKDHLYFMTYYNNYDHKKQNRQLSDRCYQKGALSKGSLCSTGSKVGSSSKPKPKRSILVKLTDE